MEAIFFNFDKFQGKKCHQLVKRIPIDIEKIKIHKLGHCASKVIVKLLNSFFLLQHFYHLTVKMI